MSADRLPDRANLGQLKRQAKDLLKAWHRAPPAGLAAPRLRDAQRAVARQYGFASWDALRDHVDQARGRMPAARATVGIDYDRVVHDTIVVSGPFTRERARRLAAQGVTGVKIEASVPPDALGHLADMPALERLDLSEHRDLSDEHLGCLEALTELTAVAFARWGKVGDRAVTLLAGKRRLSRLALGPGLTDAGVEKLCGFPGLARPVDADSLLSISAGRTLTDRALAIVGTLQGVAALDVHCSVFGSPLYTAAGVVHLKNMSALESLNFHGRLASDAVLREIAAIPRLRWLHAQDLASGDEGLVALGRCTTLEHVITRFCDAISDRGLAALARLPRLTTLNMGGRRLTDAAFAPFAAATSLTDLAPHRSRDGAFVHIAAMPKLERLVNMYNRSTTDAATRHLEGHATLRHYAAFGTQITDDSLLVLARLPDVEVVVLDNLFGITDEGVRTLARAPTLRELGVDTCARVTGSWMEAAPRHLHAKSNRGDRTYADFYRAETLLDHPELPMPDDMARPDGEPSPEIVPALGCIVPGISFHADGLRLIVSPGVNPRSVGVLTREAFAAPVRIELVVRPITELRMLFGAHNQQFAFDERGDFIDVAPWFLRLDAEKGQGHPPAGPPIPDDHWTRVTLEIDSGARRILIDGRLRHSWSGEFGGLQSRLGFGPRTSGVTVRSLTVDRR